MQLPVPGTGVPGQSGEITAGNTRVLGCVQCHMPLVRRALVEGGVIRDTRKHLWRGGHDPDMVKKALTIDFAEAPRPGQGARVFHLTLTNSGAAHYVPTGTADNIGNLRCKVSAPVHLKHFCKDDRHGMGKLVKRMRFDNVIVHLVFESGGPVARFV